jgi:hypothetical protein
LGNPKPHGLTDDNPVQSSNCRRQFFVPPIFPFSALKFAWKPDPAQGKLLKSLPMAFIVEISSPFSNFLAVVDHKQMTIFHSVAEGNALRSCRNEARSSSRALMQFRPPTALDRQFLMTTQSHWPGLISELLVKPYPFPTGCLGPGLCRIQ